MRFELGTATDLSNEIFYEEIYTDTTFLGRRLHGTPQGRTSGVAALDLNGRSGGGRWEYSARPELTLGDLITRAGSTFALRLRPDDRWRLALEPRVEYSRDLSFDVERRQVLVATTVRARRLLENDVDAIELRLGGELLRTPRSSDPYLLAHRLALAGLAWDHAAPLGWDVNARLESEVRTFPDSSQRDHQEHQIELSTRHDLPGGASIGGTGGLVRRQSLTPQASSRDRFVELRAQVFGSQPLGERFTLRLTGEHEGYVYDTPDSTIDFDYALDRLSLLLRRELGMGGALSIGARGEILTSAWNADERYREIAAIAELEWLGAARWWLVQPQAGWRAYDAPSQAGLALHSSFAFAELQVFADQALPARCRARVLLNARLERHQDESQNSRSLYFSLDLRRLF